MAAATESNHKAMSIFSVFSASYRKLVTSSGERMLDQLPVSLS
jgi:hypothetical protein